MIYDTKPCKFNRPFFVHRHQVHDHSDCSLKKKMQTMFTYYNYKYSEETKLQTRNNKHQNFHNIYSSEQTYADEPISDKA